MTRVLFAGWPFEGHVFPLLSIALAQRARGDEVVFYTGERLRPVVESQGIEVLPFDRVAPAWDRVHERQAAVHGRAQALRMQRAAFRDWLVGTIPAQVADLRAAITRVRPDVIVADGSMWGPTLILREAEPIPVAMMSTLLYALVPGRDVPLPASPLPPPRSAARRALARGVAAGIDLAARGMWRQVDALRAAEGLPPMGCAVNAYLGRLPVHLIGSVRELDLGRTDLPPGVQYVGPLVWHPPHDDATTAWLDALPQDAPWVHVTEGTSHHEQPFLLRAAAAGLAGAPAQAILTTGRDRDPAALGIGTPAPNVHVTGWLSHGELLPRCDVVVTTGGANTIVSALAAGVPLVVVPTLWDKPVNAQRVAAAGVGVRLSARRCTPETLRAAVDRVLGDPSFRRNAQAMAARMAAAPGPAGAAGLIAGLDAAGAARARHEIPARERAVHPGGDR